MEQIKNKSLLLVGVITLAASMFAGCTEYADDPAEFTTENIVINYTDSVIDASISSGSRTRSVPESTEISSGVLTSKSGKKMYLSCTEAPWPVDKNVVTRGAKVTTVGISNMGVSASVYGSSSSYTSAGCGSYFYKESVSSGTPTKFYWPTADYKISFFGYYPYNNAAFTVQSAASATGAPTYSYTVPSAIASQQDIMTGQVVDRLGGSSSPVNLTLAHRCSAIHFSITNDRSDAITVNSISIEGVKYTGTLSGSTWTLGGGVNSSSTNPFNLISNSSITAGATVDITGISNIFMMLPQTLPSGATLKVVVDDEEFEAELIGTWVSGSEYTYSLSFIEPWEYFLNVTGPTNYTYTGGTNSYSIQSYRQKDDGAVTEAAPWTVTFDADGDGVFNDSKPSWLTTFTSSGGGSISASPYEATVSAQVYSSSLGSGNAAEITTSILSSATPVVDYDLSDPNGVGSPQNTSNCYMVHAPGTYKLPLVYGNAIKNGTDNQTAYKPGSVSNGLANFINHAGTAISAPWLTKSGTGVNGGMGLAVNDAQLIWQDVNNLTTDYAIDGDYLKFKVPAASIAEGNAVIAVKVGSTIVWSWHIWVTPETYSNLTTVATGSHNYQVTPVNLGWVGSGSITKTGYAGRSCAVKITQAGGLSETFNVTQTENVTVTAVKGGNSPYYQWGRKDPFIPSNGSGNTNKTVYIGSGVDTGGFKYEGSTSATIGTNIQKPWIHYYNSSTYGPVSTTYYNMWDAKNATTNNVATATKKTIYDPCPPGFCVPTGNLWNYFGNNGSRTMSTWDSTNKGATWNTGITGDDLWFPAAGFRYNSSGALSDVGSNGDYWSATPSSTYSGRRLYFYSSYWYWNYFNRAYGFSVRPVAEE